MNSLLQTQWISKNPVGYIPAGKVEKRKKCIPAKNSQQIPKNTGKKKRVSVALSDMSLFIGFHHQKH